MLGPWLLLTAESTRLAFEAQTVIGLRLARIAAGAPDAPLEAHRMVAEKQSAFVEAALAASLLMATGGASHAVARKVVKGYRKHVRANHRRLSKGA